MKTHEYWMNVAIDEAVKSAENRGGPFGCVIVKNDEAIAITSNSVTIDNDPTAHAEVNAIRKACKTLNTFNLSGCRIYTSCEPCPMCLSACYWARIDKIYYCSDRKDAEISGFDDKHIYEEIELPMDKRKIPVERIMNEKGNIPFEIWNHDNNKVKY